MFAVVYLAWMFFSAKEREPWLQWTSRHGIKEYLCALDRLALQIDASTMWSGSLFDDNRISPEAIQRAGATEVDVAQMWKAQLADREGCQLFVPGRQHQLATAVLAACGKTTSSTDAMRMMIDLGIYDRQRNNLVHGLYRRLGHNL